jgi:hypothetical protein
MARTESFQCDVCNKMKSDSEIWWLGWVDCFAGEHPGEDQPLLKLTRWHRQQAHAPGVKHLCGARCAETLMDRWISEQRVNLEAHCETVASEPEAKTHHRNGSALISQ